MTIIPIFKPFNVTFIVATISTDIATVVVIPVVVIVAVVAIIIVIVAAAITISAIAIAAIVILDVTIPCLQWRSCRLLVQHFHSHLEWLLLLRLHAGHHLLLRLLCY